MELKNLEKVFDKVEESLKKYHETDYMHYFVIDHPSWDDQHIYYEISYTVEAELFYGGYIEICIIAVEELDECVKKIKEKFNLPFRKWERVLVDFG